MRFSVINADRGRLGRCFDDVIVALEDALVTCGHDVVQISDSKPGRVIAFGCGNAESALSEDTIIFNAEQVASKDRRVTQNMAVLRNHVVWDYSRSNIEWLKDNGARRAILCPIGYTPSMERLEIPSTPPGIDVLWYGAINDRRAEILSTLDQARLGVKRLVNVYGKDRDYWISRSKVVLNLHYYDNAVFEIFRCSHLFANHKAVVSESGGIDPDLESFAKKACVVVDKDSIAETCLSLCKDSKKRQELEETGYNEFRKLDFVESVRNAVIESI